MEVRTVGFRELGERVESTQRFNFKWPLLTEKLEDGEYLKGLSKPLGLGG